MTARKSFRLGATALLAALLVPSLAGAGSVDLATTPMVSGITKVVKPNVLFVLDDSGSMDWEYMPDTSGNISSSNYNSANPCQLNFGYNTIFYNPAINYAVPLNYNGTSFSSASVTAAKNDGYASTSSTVNLTSTSTVTNTTTQTINVSLGNNPFTMTNGSKTVVVQSTGHGLANNTTVSFSISTTYLGIKVNGSYQITVIDANRFSITDNQSASSSGTAGGSGKSYSYDVSTTTTTQAPNYFYYEYTASPTSPPSTCASSGSYTKVAVSSLSSTQQQNFANWFQYYRKRIFMMRAAASRTFASLDSSYRVGFTKISDTGTGSDFVPIKTFDSTQKNTWFTTLFRAAPSGFTPLLGALSKAGRYYGGRLVTGSADPVQYSCQQNFTILTTDGYWNSVSSSYGPNQLDNSTLVGNQDGSLAAPYYDANASTLADVASYYYQTDLRTAGGSWATGGYLDGTTTRLDVTSNNVPPSTADPATWQHMVTFTIGLGQSGNVLYDSQYYLNGGTLTCPTGSTTCVTYKQILQGTKPWPNPLPTENLTRIDDLWHAAVDGHGRYLSARDPNALVTSLQSTLSTISAMKASSAATATSNLQPVSGDNSAYVAQYTTATWTGDLQQRDIDLVTGGVGATAGWSVATQLEGMVDDASDTRTIYTFSSSASNKLKAFNATNLTSEIAAGYFKGSGSNPGGALSQWSTLTGSQQALATDTAMINYIRGQSGNQFNSNNSLGFYRDRASALGDIVDGAPVYVSPPNFNYADSGYSSFKTSWQSRRKMVYAASNDGMLHAIDANNGNELWAYIPTAVISKLYKLADYNYPTNHQFLVDGPITVGDIWDGSAWRTILVGGLGNGGRAFYALDVTDPTAPKALWEFAQSGGSVNDADLGYSYGNPVITKRASDSRWVVIVASGYNNTSGDSKGRLYVLDAGAGTLLSEIVTDSNNDPNISGIAKVSNYVTNSSVDNRSQYVYGGDLGGRLWRFDINAGTSKRLGQTSSTLGNQPITVRPELGSVTDSAGTAWRVVYFGTGRYI
ncbi:MAG: hypothetical protein RLZZ200_565, partial [Pseudomonadota bacterium]